MTGKVKVYVVVYPNRDSQTNVATKKAFERHIERLEELINDEDRFSFVILDGAEDNFHPVDPKELDQFRNVREQLEAQEGYEPMLLTPEFLAGSTGKILSSGCRFKTPFSVEQALTFDRCVYVTHPKKLGDTKKRFGRDEERSFYQVIADKILKDNYLRKSDHMIIVVGNGFHSHVSNFALAFKKRKLDVYIDLKYTDAGAEEDKDQMKKLVEDEEITLVNSPAKENIEW